MVGGVIVGKVGSRGESGTGRGVFFFAGNDADRQTDRPIGRQRQIYIEK